MVTYGSDSVDIYAVADRLQHKGWGVDRQQDPPTIHCTVNANNAQVLDEYLADVREAFDHVRAHPELASEGEAAMYGLMAKIPLRGLVKSSVLEVMEQMYGPDGELPELGSARGDDGPLLRAVHRLNALRSQWGR